MLFYGRTQEGLPVVFKYLTETVTNFVLLPAENTKNESFLTF